jgi:hypothetical protein
MTEALPIFSQLVPPSPIFSPLSPLPLGTNTNNSSSACTPMKPSPSSSLPSSLSTSGHKASSEAISSPIPAPIPVDPLPALPAYPATSARRRLRFDMLDVQRVAAPYGDRSRSCLMLPRRGESTDIDGVRYQTDDDIQATFKGAGRCGQRFCVICGPKIGQYRATETSSWLHEWFAAGGSGFYWCLTLPRTKGENPDRLLDDLRKLIAAPFRGRERAQLVSAVGGEVFKFEGVEVTVGLLDDGRPDMHVHLHGLVLVAASDRTDTYHRLFNALACRLFRPARLLGRTMHERHGFVLKPLGVNDDGTIVGADTLSSYIHKGAGWGVAMELHGDAYKLAKGEGARFNAAQLLHGFAETGDMAFRSAYTDVLRFMAGKRLWIKPTRWADTLAYVTAHGIDALNHTDRQRVLSEGATIRAADQLTLPLVDPEHSTESPQDDEPERVDCSPTDDEIANQEHDGGTVVVSFGPHLWRWICLTRGLTGAVANLIRTAPSGEVFQHVGLLLQRANCPLGLADELYDREHEPQHDVP